ncbi:MAG: hypothetical protein LUF85_17255 [Bacteroides sp.]|nr:hypothetical protein [Bacteroides sp.]
MKKYNTQSLVHSYLLPYVGCILVIPLIYSWIFNIDRGIQVGNLLMGNLSLGTLGSLYMFRKNNSNLRKNTFQSAAGWLVTSALTGWIGFAWEEFSLIFFTARPV